MHNGVELNKYSYSRTNSPVGVRITQVEPFSKDSSLPSHPPWHQVPAAEEQRAPPSPPLPCFSYFNSKVVQGTAHCNGTKPTFFPVEGSQIGTKEEGPKHAQWNSPGCPGHGLTRCLDLAILLYSKDTCWLVHVAI